MKNKELAGQELDTHQPVMLAEVITALAMKPDGRYVDGTLGRGGHSQAMIERLGPAGRLLMLDRDLAAISYAQQRFASDVRITIVHRGFAEMPAVLQQAGLLGQVDGLLLDLGVSSPQLDQAERGFSFSLGGPLDMRMDTSQGLSVGEWLKTVDEVTLADVLWRYGEEQQSRRIARAIVKARTEAPMTTTRELAQIIAAVMPPSHQLGKHPATRSFQALRIFINAELDQLHTFLEQAMTLLAAHGRLAIISFHSLEDRIVKQWMQRQVQGIEPPRGMPLREVDIQRNQTARWCVKMAKPSDAEVAHNPRARSAILRVIEKC